MIHRIHSDLPTFKSLEFRPGLNILLADKSPGATDRQTRNGAGKTSLIEIVHFLLGGSCERGSIFTLPELRNVRFGLEFDLAKVRTTVERSGANPKTVFIVSGGPTYLDANASLFDRDSGLAKLSNQDWKRVLGKEVFGIEELDESDKHERFCPSFRSLFSYFVRQESSGGFASPFQTFAKQADWVEQVSITFLLGLDWTIPQRLQEIREERKSHAGLKKIISDGKLRSVFETPAQLQTHLVIAKGKAEKIRKNLADFRVLPQYRELERECNSLQRELQNLMNEDVIDQKALQNLERVTREESPPDFSDLARLYQEVGVTLPETALRRFDEVKNFHKSVVRNRKSYLQSEMETLRDRIAERIERMKIVDAQKSQIMSTLKAHGALDEYLELQERLTKAQAEAEILQQKFEAAKKLEGQKTEFDIERKKLFLRLTQDHEEREEAIRKAILAFEEISSALYEEGGSLTIEPSQNGPHFAVEIHGEKSKGIKNMQAFCFDLMLMQLWQERGLGPGFLIHDSHLFDGADERQIASALQIGSEMANRFEFQYVVTMNSDAVPKTFPENFHLEDYVLQVRLTDAEDGGLFGFRFS